MTADDTTPARVAAAAEVEHLRRWKAEALHVLAEWERVWEALGKPGPLGASKASAVLATLDAQPGDAGQCPGIAHRLHTGAVCSLCGVQDRPQPGNAERAGGLTEERPSCNWPRCRSPQTGKCFAWCKCQCHEWSARRLVARASGGPDDGTAERAAAEALAEQAGLLTDDEGTALDEAWHLGMLHLGLNPEDYVNRDAAMDMIHDAARHIAARVAERAMPKCADLDCPIYAQHRAKGQTFPPHGPHDFRAAAEWGNHA